MLRVGLTGDLGSGKSTVAAMLGALGATVFSSDEMARAMMQQGEPVYAHIVERFGRAVVRQDGSLDRSTLARLAFAEGRVEELNAIVHPAVLREQARLLEELAHAQPDAVAVVESALIFNARHGVAGQPWRERFDRMLLVRAPLEQKVRRFVARLSAGRELTAPERGALEEDARARLALQTTLNEAHAAECLVLANDGDLEQLRRQVVAAWAELRQAEPASG